MDPVEQIARELHEAWREYRTRQGWSSGPRDEARKTHPHLVPWEKLADEESRNQDRFLAALLLKSWTETSQLVSPDSIHEAWRTWEHVQGNYRHPHDLPYSDAAAHGGSRGPQEHALQAERVNQILNTIPVSQSTRPTVPASEMASAYEDAEWAAFENNCAKASL